VSLRRAKRLRLEELAPVLLELPLPPRPLSWIDVFGNDLPVEIEVGFGKGLFLLTTSGARPQVNFLGIEIDRKYQLYAATRLIKLGRRNVKLACADARVFLAERVASGSVQAVHVYFPDPWWKRRHVKRRLFTPGFAQVVAAVLRPGGRLHVATDVPDYFALVQDALERTKLERLPAPDAREPAHDLDYLTNFERKFRKAGKEIHRGEWEKLS
jgi:tRNA (guanine-N7-)-methyltransferase